jgi:hypothetical protein
MTTFNEIRQLVEAARERGAVINFCGMDDDGQATLVEVASGIPGCGPFPMPLIAAAEKLRAFVAATPVPPVVAPALDIECGLCGQAMRARKADIKPAALFDDITGASYKGFAFREILRTDEDAYAAAYILAEKVRHLVD